MKTSSDTPGVLPLLPEVKASEQEVRAIVDAIPHPISVYGPDGAFLYVNRVGRELAGIAMATLVGALVIARAVDDPALSDEVLEATATELRRR